MHCHFTVAVDCRRFKPHYCVKKKATRSAIATNASIENTPIKARDLLPMCDLQTPIQQQFLASLFPSSALM